LSERIFIFASDWGFFFIKWVMEPKEISISMGAKAKNKGYSALF
jgi:hypothetical protein